VYPTIGPDFSWALTSRLQDRFMRIAMIVPIHFNRMVVKPHKVL
jgi:hypothetical protein